MANLLTRLRAALFGQGSTASQSAQGLLAGVLTSTQAPRRGTRELLQAYKRLPWLHTLLRRIAEDTASIPWEVYAPTSRKRGKHWARTLAHASHHTTRSMLLQRALASGELRRVEEHPFLEVLAGMNPALGGFDSWVIAQLHLDLVGQAPLVRENNAMGLPLELWPVAPHWIQDTPRPGAPFYRASYNGWVRNIPEEHMVWGRVPDPEQPYARGSSYGEATADEIDVGELRARWVKNFFHNSARPDALVVLPGATEPQATQFKEAWLQQHRGASRAGTLHVTGAKDLKYEQLQQTMQEMQLQEQRGEDRDIIAQVLNFPPELMGVLESSNRATIESAYYLYALGALVPRKRRQVGLMQPLLHEYDESLTLGFATPVPEDKEAQARHMVAVPAAFKVNEHRAMGGQQPLEGEEGEALFEPPAAANPLGGLGFSVGREPAWVKALPVRRAYENVLEALRPEYLGEEVGPVEEEGFRQWAEAAMREVGVEPRFDMRNPLVRQRLERYAGERIRLITETTREAVRQALAESASAGEGAREAARRVREVFSEAETYRAERIARTELVGLANGANVEAWRQSGVVEGKEWLAVRDGATRDEHRDLDGQRTGLDGLFRVGEYSAAHPGGFGVASMDVNCRCTALPMVSTKAAMSEEQKAATWKDFDQRLARWEEGMLRALRRGFARQREAVLSSLEG